MPEAKIPCYLCGGDTNGRLGACDACLKKRAELRANTPNWNSGSKSSARSNLWIFLIPVLLIALFVLKPQSHRSMPPISLVNAYGTPEQLCERAQPCLVAYLTPWCPACAPTLRSMPELAQYVENEVGAQFHLVIGNSDPGRLRQFAAAVSTPALFDDRDQVIRLLGRGAVPRFYVVNAEGKITKSVSGFVRGGTLESRRRWYKQRFPL